MKTSLSIVVLFLLMLVYSCTKSGGTVSPSTPDPDPGNGNNQDCDTVNMKYMANVVPILQQNCYRCHGATTNSGSFGIVLEGHGNLKPYAESGTLIGVITHAQGYVPMPEDGAKLSECDINKIRSWIAHGIQNN
jgi:hypothetical protein